jgi:hypothetical protein
MPKFSTHRGCCGLQRTPKLFDGLNCESKGEDIERKRSWGTLPGSQHFGGRRVCWSSRIKTRKIDKEFNYSHGPTQNQTTSWLIRSWSTFGAWTNHEQTHTHKIHHGPNLGKATTFSFIVYFVLGHRTNTQMSFCLGTPKLES